MMTPEFFTELFLRAVATAAVVVGVTIAVERMGAVIGGALGGLPIVIGPGFFFLLQEQSTDFVVGAAISSLIALTASQAFLTGYIVVARLSPAAILAASTCWLLAALLLSQAPASSWFGAGLFFVSTALGRFLTRGFDHTHRKVRVRGGWLLLLSRGIAAGLLVAGVTAAADRIGDLWTGFLMTYPIAMTVISVTVHQRSGADIVVATLRSMMLGIGSIAAFTFTLAVALSPFGEFWAFVAALAAGAAITGGLTVRSLRQTK